MRHAFADVNGIAIHYAEAGDGPLILLLHGFPEFWYGWRHQIAALSGAGFRVVAPDLRGYNLSDKPRGAREYRVDLLVEDVVGLIEALGEKEVVLVGHDWGGVIAWWVAMRYPRSVRRLVILNAPHPAAYRRELRRPSSQIWRSWYAGFFQIPAVPEAVLKFGDYALLRTALRRGAARSEDEVEAYRQAFVHPGALTAAINYYRAVFRYPMPTADVITTPTLLIWGERDPFLVPRLAQGLDPWVEHLRVERLSHVTHWLHHEDPDTVNELIIGFARSGGGGLEA